MAKLIADLLETNDFDGFVFEFSYSQEAIPTFTEIRKAIGTKEMITVVAPEHCSLLLIC